MRRERRARQRAAGTDQQADERGELFVVEGGTTGHGALLVQQRALEQLADPCRELRAVGSLWGRGCGRHGEQLEPAVLVRSRLGPMRRSRTRGRGRRQGIEVHPVV